MGEDFFALVSANIDTLLNLAGDNPFEAMWFLFLKGGWLVFVFIAFWIVRAIYHENIQHKFNAKKEWILLRIIVPRASEQTVKATENMFVNFSGTHTNPSWTEKWIQGMTQSPIAVEIASIEGRVSYYVHSERRFRDLVEASIYAQYPDADIDEVDDYAKNVPGHYPDEEWDLWGTELMPLKSDAYPLKTYSEFEDKVSGEFKDPLAVMLENLARMGPGEQIWYQIILIPTDQKEAHARAEKEIKKLKGIKEEHKKTALDFVAELPIAVTQEMANVAFGLGGGEHKKEEKKSEFPRLMQLSPGEKNVLEAVERKASKIGFMVKIRFLYVAKKTVLKKARAVHPFIGAIKQMNAQDMLQLKPESKHVGVNNNFWWFKSRRNNHRKAHLVSAYRRRSSWAGLPSFFLSVEELATMWHFPIFLQVKAPSLAKTEAKKVEPPANIPFG